MRKLHVFRQGIRPLAFLFFCLFSTQLLGQCYPPPQAPTQYCANAPLVCLQDICTSTNPWDMDFFAEPEDWCMTTNPSHHPHYYLFQATETLVQIYISVTTCHGVALCGLQAVIINQCAVGFNPWTSANVIACDALACINEQLILAPGNMVPGQNYWLMIDNDGDDFCAYQIDFLQGVLLPDIAEDLTNAGTNDAVVCPGQDSWTAFAEPPLATVQGYYWTGFPWAPGYHITRFANMSGNGEPLAIPDNAPPGVYQICVVGFTGCDTTDTPQCFDLEIVDLDGVSPPVTVCPEDFGNQLIWEGLTITAPGTYTQTYMSAEGCPYDSTKQFSTFPETFEGYIDTVICGEFLIYEGEEYFNPGYYPLYYEGANAYGCDSMAFLSLDLTYIEFETDFFCRNDTFFLTSEVIVALPSMSGILYKWYRNGVLVSTAPNFSTLQSGTYTLVISRFECDFVGDPIIIDRDELVPPQPDLAVFDTIACANTSAMYTVLPVLNTGIRFYEWSVDPPQVPIVFFDTLNSGALINWQGFTGGTVCVHARNHCGPGIDTCFEVSVINAPVAAFDLQANACVGSTVPIQFTGGGSPDADFIWNFGGGTVVSGGIGPGPHQISWNSPGTHTVSLQVVEMGCDTSAITHDIFIESLGAPVVSCNSTLNSVTFEWSPVSGAVNYQVNVLQGPAGTIMDDTSYVVTGLAAGTLVEIQIIVTGVGACPPTMVTAQCIAQSCPPRVIQIQIPADTLCLGDVVGTIQLNALVDGSPGNGTWSGPGVSANGVFDPNSPMAGPGVHTIVFMYSEGTCLYQRSRNITIIETPTASFNLNAAICQASNATVTYTGNASVNASYTWNFGSGVATGSGAGPYSVTWASPGMYNISLVVAERGCTSLVVSHTIDVQPVITAPVISCFPSTSSVTIEWSVVPNATTYDIVHLFGPMGTVTGNQYNVTNLSPGDSVAIEITVSGNTLCPPVTIVASCVAQDCPTPTIVIDPVDDICLYNGTGTADLNVSVTNGSGSGMWSGNGIIDLQQGIFDPNIAGEGSHLIEYHYLDNGCSFVESITISVFDPPSAVISNTTFTLTCDNNSELVLDGTSSTGGGALTFLWTTSNGLIIGPANQSTVTAGAAGEYFLTVIDQVSMCEDVVSVMLVEDTGLPNADAGPDGLIDCNTEFIEVGGNSSSGPSITYAWSTSDGTIDTDPTSIRVTVSDGGTYVLTVTDTDNGCTAVDQVVVVLDIAPPTGVLAVSGILDCDTESVTVSSMVSPAGTPFTYVWQTANGRIVSGNGTATIVADRVGTYTLIVTRNDNGCMDTVSIDVMADPASISGLNTLVDPPKCVGDKDGMIEILNPIGGTTPYTYAWSNQTSGSGLLFLAPGTYTVTVTDANGCSFVESYVLPEPVPIDPDIGADLTHDYNETVMISLSVTNPANIADISWGGIAPLCPGCLDISFPAEVSGNVIVTVVDLNGCVASDTLHLTVDINRTIFIPNVFSPNNDGVNDFFTIRGKLLERIEYLRIFDRWGGLVFEQPSSLAGDLPGWDGTFNMKDLDPGVFVYTAKLIHADGTEEFVIGDVTLVR